MSDPFDAAGTLSAVYRGVDWAATPLGPVDGWSPVLLSTVELMLASRAPITLIWGPEYVLLYNEAYVPMIFDKHPAALGASCRDVFAEVWDTIGPMLDSVRAGHGATWVEDMRLFLDRRGYLEETYFTFSYSAVDGAEGVIDIAAETTVQVIGARRLNLLSRLNGELSDLGDLTHLNERVLPVLRSSPADLPEVSLVFAPASPLTAEATVTDRDVRIEHDAPGGPIARLRLDASAEGPMLVARLSPHLPVDDDYLGFLRLIGAALAQGLNRIRIRQAELRSIEMERELSETLQRSLLAPAAQPAHLDVAVRYQPAAAGAQIGGDWYDAFELPDGRLTVVVGDVSGHDRHAAAGMSQLRNLLRGISHALLKPPARVLAALNEAMTALRVDVFATVVLAQIDPDNTVTWSNAGHPPPVLMGPDGAVHLLDPPAEPLLGIRRRRQGTDHTVHLPPGSSIVLYTDGLIERRAGSLDDGLTELLTSLAAVAPQNLTADQLSDHLLATFTGATEDDVVLCVVQAR